MSVRAIRPEDRAPLQAMLSRVENFNAEEVAVAMELIDASLAAPGKDYSTVVAEGTGGQVVGYLCYGPTPMTDGTYDLYWMAVEHGLRGRGWGKKLVEAFEHLVRGSGGRIVRIETSSQESYGGTLEFYLKRDYTIVGTIPDFYKAGDDLITLAKKL